MKNIHASIATLALILLCSIGLHAQQFFFSAERPTTCSAPDGIITIVPTRGVPPFTYQWSNGATTLSAHNIQKGVYSATLTDATGATVSHTYYLNSNELDLYLDGSKPVTYCNPTSGELTIQTINGVAPYAYTWSNGQSGPVCQNLGLGFYGVTVTDASGCTAENVFEVHYVSGNYYPSAVIDATTFPNCANLNGGVLTASMVYSGYTPNTYTWSTGATTESISNVSAGTYTVTVTDGLGCPRIVSRTVENELNTTASVICTGNNTGTATAVLVNGTAPISYQWSNGQIGPNLSNLPAGFYVVTAIDANGCSATQVADVANPILTMYNNTPQCYAGNGGGASCWVNGDNVVSYLWDDGETNNVNYTLSPGLHSVTVTTSLGCVLAKTIVIPPPIAPPITVATTTTPADCSTGSGGSLALNISGGVSPYTIYMYGPGGSTTSSSQNFPNLAAGTYYLSIYNPSLSGCSTYTNVSITDAGGFNPELMVTGIKCSTGTADAAILNITTPGVLYNWSNGLSTPDIYNLSEGCYNVTVTGPGTCQQYYEFCVGDIDSLQGNSCLGRVTGALLNDLGVAGCTGTQGIPYQMIKTLPSGAITFTDENGFYDIGLASGSQSDILPANYDPVDIACPPGGKYTVTSSQGFFASGFDFHFSNANATDRRVKQRALRTAQPGYPYSLRYEICNDGNTPVNGALDMTYNSMFGPLSAAAFAQHPGAFSLATETTGTPNNSSSYNYTTINTGACELLQADFTTPSTIPVSTAFETSVFAGPTSGDVTPDNNKSGFFSAVSGSFDPNGVYAYPVRTGNPHEGGDILRNVDTRITYQIFFQNTGNAPADIVVIRDTIDANLEISSIRNLSTTHTMDVSIAGDNNNILVFRFPNINLPDSSIDYASSIGSVQYDIDLKPGLAVGTHVNNQAAIFFDFNPPVHTNTNVLQLVNPSDTNSPTAIEDQIQIFPNPADAYVGFYTDTVCRMQVYNSLGSLVLEQSLQEGLQRVSTVDLPGGIYMIRLDNGKKIQHAKVVVSH